MEPFSNDHKDFSNQHKNSHKLFDGMGHSILSLMESQWKMIQQNDQNLPQWKGSHWRTNTCVRRKNKSYRAGLWESQSLWWTVKSPKITILQDGLIDRTSSILDEITSSSVLLIIIINYHQHYLLVYIILVYKRFYCF